jgi:hypothetical protein
MYTVNWIKSRANTWLDFLTFDLSTAGQSVGVYIIWHVGLAGGPGYVVKVGQGQIWHRLGAHRNDPAILAYRKHGLRVTWVELPENLLDGVECYLGNRLRPLVGDRFSECAPFPLNLPQWAA